MNINQTQNQFTIRGEMASLIKAYPWENSSLGAMSNWPAHLHATLNIMLHTDVPMFLWWSDAFVQFYNDSYRQSLGMDSEYPLTLGRRGDEAVTWPMIKPVIEQVMESGKAVSKEDQLVRLIRNKELEHVYWTFNYSPVLGPDGKVDGVLMICTETTREKVFEKEIAESKNALQLALRRSEFSEKNIRNLMIQAPVAMALLQGEQFIVEIANDLMCELWGKTSTDILGMPVFEVLPEVRAQGLEELINTVYKSGKRYSASERPVVLRRKDRLTTIYLNFLYEPLRNADGNIIGIIAVATDVTSIVASRQEAEENEREFRQLADSLPHIVWTARPDGYIDYYNKQWYDFTGYKESFGDESWMPILHPDDVQPCLDIYYHSIKTGEPYAIEYRFKDYKNGGYRWFLGKAQPIKDADGHIIKWFGSCTDIDAQKSFSEKLEQKVKERTIELQKMNVELESFAYVASHDLQEPLRKIQTYSDRILTKEEANLSDNGKEYFRRLQGAASRMQTLINDLLDYSRTNDTSTVPEMTDLDEILADVLNEFKDSIASKEAVIEKEPLGSARIIPYQFRQVFQNLLGNSLKFSRPGVPLKITIAARISRGRSLPPGLTQDTAYTHLTFTDNGIGFDEQYRYRIFEMFQRLNGRSEYEGTGIGLAIVSKIIENHQGTIQAHSKLGEGSEFEIYIPV